MRLHAVLAMRLWPPPCDDLFSVAGREWLAGCKFDAEGRLLLDSDLRLLDHIEEEIEQLDKLLAQKAYPSALVRQYLLGLKGGQVCRIVSKWRR